MPADQRWRVLGRRAAVIVVVVLQAALIARGYSSAHKEFGFQMFPEASTWQAEVVRVTADGRRVSVSEPWAGYRWNDLVDDVGLQSPWVRHHAYAGVDNQLAFLAAALDWVASHTPRDQETSYLEATTTVWHNDDAPTVVVYRSRERGPQP
jgi:hypothetical protein